MAIVLIGFMGAGKSTAARELGKALGQRSSTATCCWPSSSATRSPREFELRGEAAFRASEEELVCELLARAHPEDVIALGGGSVLSERVRDALGRGHLTVLLDVDAETAWQRVGGNGDRPERPLAGDRDAFRALHAERAPLYEQLAEAVVPGLGAREVARLAPTLRVLGERPRAHGCCGRSRLRRVPGARRRRAAEPRRP